MTCFLPTAFYRLQSCAQQYISNGRMFHDQEIQEIVAEIRDYNISLNREQRIELFTDGLCENPGAMHIGLFARQGNKPQ
jgi:hypothetical protein